jgi:hypothetical protein
MSLHHLAEQVRAAGRKNDKVLVHMTPNEVNGLQALALAHGGSLTINPHTGLPEADFLDAILPMAAGFLLAPLTAGTSLAFLGATPLASALTVGAVSGLATGSLEKGLMAGLGAYGGAGLGAGLSGGTAASTAGKTITGAPAVGSSTVSAAPTPSLFGGTNIGGNVDMGFKALSTPTPALTPTNTLAANFQLPSNAVRASTNYMAPNAQAGLFSTPNPTPLANQMEFSRAVANAPVSVPTTAAAPTSSSMFSNYSMPNSFGEFYDKLPTGTLPALAVTGMHAMNSKKPGLGALPVGDSYERPYEYSVEQDPEAYIDDGSTRERAYFKEPRFKALPIRKVADGGLMDEPAGNVERMSEGNVVEMQRQEDNIPRYAFGGSAAFAKAKAEEPSTNVSYTYDPATMQYTQTTTAPPPSTNNQMTGNPLIDGMFGLAPYMRGASMAQGGGGGVNPRAGGGKGSLMGLMARQAPTPQPTVTTQTMGGMSTPYVPQGMNASAPMFANSNITPNINIPEQKTPEEQLGLQSFYQNMEKQLAAKGAQIMSQNMAGGGVTGYAGGGSPSNTQPDVFKEMEAQGINPFLGSIPLFMKMIGGNVPDSLMPPSMRQSQAQNYTYNPNSLEFQNLGTGEVSNGIAAAKGYADGGYTLGGYSDGGRLLKGPGDGVSDSIPAVIGDRQPARLADGEFVVPARIVSELGNGSTEAGAKKLYAMMNRVQNARKKSIGKGKVAVNSKAEKLLPA